MMPLGWDNEPEYGGPEPTWREAIVIVPPDFALSLLSRSGSPTYESPSAHGQRLMRARSPEGQ
jgi:hypothetical protein